MQSDRAAKRQLIREIEEAGRRRFGQHVAFRVYCDTSDSDPRDYDACLQYVKRPPNVTTDVMFPPDTTEGITEKTKLAALRGLLDAINRGNK